MTIHYLVETHHRLYTDRGFLCEPKVLAPNYGDPTYDLPEPITRNLDEVTCPECLRRLADQTAKRLRQLAGDPLWEAALTRIPGETDDGFRTRIEAIMRRS